MAFNFKTKVKKPNKRYNMDFIGCLRLIYAYFKETEKIVFIELYHKNDKEKGR